MQENEPVKEGGLEEEADIFQKLTRRLKEVREAYEAAQSSDEKIKFNLYAVPKLMEVVKEAEMENVRRREAHEEEINVAGLSDFEALVQDGVLEKDYNTVHKVDGREETVHHTGHLAEIKKLAQQEWDQQHPKE